MTILQPWLCITNFVNGPWRASTLHKIKVPRTNNFFLSTIAVMQKLQKLQSCMLVMELMLRHSRQKDPNICKYTLGSHRALVMGALSPIGRSVLAEIHVWLLRTGDAAQAGMGRIYSG